MKIGFAGHLIKKEIDFLLDLEFVYLAELVYDLRQAVFLEEIVIKADVKDVVSRDLLPEEFMDDQFHQAGFTGAAQAGEEDDLPVIEVPAQIAKIFFAEFEFLDGPVVLPPGIILI